MVRCAFMLLMVLATAAGAEELAPRTQYAVRRIGGPGKLGGCSYEFTQAFNEAPIVDCDLDKIGRASCRERVCPYV